MSETKGVEVSPGDGCRSERKDGLAPEVGREIYSGGWRNRSVETEANTIKSEAG